MNNLSRRTYLTAAATALISVIVYLPALQNGFVTWDDDIYVFENYHIRSLGPAFFKWAFFDFYASNWHPLTWLSHALDFTFWGLSPLGHHLTNIALHGVNVFFVVLLVARLLDTYQILSAGKSFLNERAIMVPAAATGLLFGLHPAHVESVAWISERKDLLCALFFLLSVMTYLKYAASRQPVIEVVHSNTSGQRTKAKGERLPRSKQHPMDASRRVIFFMNKHYIAALVFFILALMSKPMAVSLPLVLLILDWHPFGKIRSAKTLRIALVEKIPFISLSLGSSILTMLAQRAGGAMDALGSVPLSTRLPVAAKSLIAYLGKMLWPFDLSPYYLYPHDVSLLAPEYMLSMVLALGITIACAFLAKQQRLWLAAWGYYVATLLPVLGVVQVGIQAMADRYTYLPSLGLFLVLALGAARLGEKAFSWTSGRFAIMTAAVVAAVSILVLLSVLTVKQTGVWKDSVTLWGSVIETSPVNLPFAHMNRAVAHEKAGRLAEAIADYDAAIDQDPAYAEAYANRGVAYEKAGKIDQAIADYQKAIALDPSSAQTYFNLGTVYLGAGRLVDAVEQYDRAISLDPRHADAFHNRGVALADSGQAGGALEDYNQAISLNRNYDIAYFNRGSLYFEMGKTELARRDFRMACELGYENGCSALKSLP